MPSSIIDFLKSFTHAVNGFIAAVKTQRNLRFMLCAAVIAITFGWVCALDRLQWGVLAIAIGGVLSCELLNTAIEATVDINVKKHLELAKLAKDVAAAAALTASLAALAVGYMLFFTQERMGMILFNLREFKFLWGLCLAFMAAFIFVPCKNKTKYKHKN